MKTLKLTVLLLSSMLIINSCTDAIEKSVPEAKESIKETLEVLEQENLNDGDWFPFYQHMLWLSFQDTQGNDLVKGLEYFYSDNEVLPGLYNLAFIYPEGIENPWNPKPQSGVIYHERTPKLYLHTTPYVPVYDDSNYSYLWFYTQSPRHRKDSSGKVVDATCAEKIIFRFICPHLFGDNEAHDIITWWKPYVYETGEAGAMTICYRMELNGKEFTVTDGHVATVVLDK